MNGRQRRDAMGAARILAMVAVGVLTASCGSDGVDPHRADVVGLETVPAVGAAPEPATVAAAPAPEVVPARPVEPSPAVAPAPEIQELEQPAIWPADDVVFDTPEDVAADFVREVLGVEPLLGEFRQGDSRSGEMPVLFAGEVEGTEPVEVGMLLLRRLTPTDGWFVLGATSDGATISSPAPRDGVPAAPLAVAGEARGFEGTVVVSAFPAGDAAAVLDQEISRGGVFEELEPFTAELDLSAASPGTVVAVLVQGDVGLDDDPGSFAAIPVVITLPPTR